MGGWGYYGDEERIFIISMLRGKISGQVLFLIPPAILHWFDGNQFLDFLQEEWSFRYVVEDVMLEDEVTKLISL